MSVKFEIKGTLARLLATEDIAVEHKNVETAQFNVYTRVLVLPMWEKASNAVYDMLVGHEVGHALYTPDMNWLGQYKTTPVIVNIVEDVRIERKVKQRYGGLSKDFYKAYQELSDMDFFAIKDVDVNEMSFADRINLHFKIGAFVPIQFNDHEKTILRQIADCETFEDVLRVSEIVYTECMKEVEEQKTEVPMQGNGSPNNSQSQGSDQETGENESVEPEPGESYGGTASHQVEDDEEEEDDPLPHPTAAGSHTTESLEEALKKLNNPNAVENIYIERPKMFLDRLIIPNQKIHDGCEQYWEDRQSQFDEMYATVYENSTGEKYDIFARGDADYMKFKKSAQVEVNYMVKEFECKKSAAAYSRATTSRTGVLDCTKLHTYKYNEDLFKKVTILPEGKNHGLVFVLDWSGSMGNVLLDTMKQLYNLMWFCKKVGIPFEVYAFTADYPKETYYESSYEKREGGIYIQEHVSLMNLFTSKVSTRKLEKQMLNIWRVASRYTHSNYAHHDVPVGLSLSGTPLNEAVLALHQIIPQFKKENNVEKVQCVILTDGEGYGIRYHSMFQRSWEAEPSLGLRSAEMQDGVVFRDRKTGKNYNLNVGLGDTTDVLLRNLKDNFPQMNLIGIRVLAPRDSGGFIRKYTGYAGDEFEKLMSAWKKTKTLNIKTSGYDAYFGFSSTALSQDDEFVVQENATKTQIKTAFIKSLKSKKLNKKILSDFVQLVA